ncbi:hypothetical protein G6F46_015059 [Rhizopus delemar]|nr:hypothetical protein G6F46_015059 [Rhizopus delemar]
MGLPAGFADGQGVHVRAQPDRPIAVPRLQRAHHTSSPHPAPYPVAPALQAVRHDRAGAMLLIAQLRMPVDVPADALDVFERIQQPGNNFSMQVFHAVGLLMRPFP